MPFGTPLGTKGRSASSATQATSAIAVASGSTIIVGVAWTGTATFTSLVDNAGNTYTIIGADIPIDVGGTNHARQYRCQNCVGNAALVITLTLSGATTLEVLAVAIPGAAVVSVDQSNAATDAASPFGSGNITTTQAREMLVSIMFGNSGSNPATHAESTGFSIVTAAEETNGTTFWTGATGTRLVTSVGTYAASWTESGGTSAAVFIVSLKEAADGGAARGLGPSGGPRKNRLRSTRSFISSANTDLTLALTGSAIAYSAGTLAPSQTVSLAGQSYAWSSGALTPAFTLALTGTAEAYSAGTLAPSITIALAGTQYAYSAGTISASTGGDLTLALTGSAISYSSGTLAPSSAVALTGSAETYSTGTVGANHAQPVTGIAEAYSTGVLTPSTTLSLAGQAYAYSSGTLTANSGGDVTVALSGSLIGWAAGDMVASGADTAKGAGRTRQKRRLEVEIDGQIFPVESLEQAQALLDRAREIATKRAEVVAEQVVRTKLADKPPENKPIRVPVPQLHTDNQELVNIVIQARHAIARIYREQALAAEIRLRLELADRESDEDDVLSLLL